MSRSRQAVLIAAASVLSLLALAVLLLNRPAPPEEEPVSLRPAEPSVAYLYPAGGTPQNIWLAVPGRPESARQLIFSPTGIYDFSVSPDGRFLAYSEYLPESEAMNLMLLDLETGGITQLTNCPEAACRRPVWRPGGQIIAYERVELGEAAAGRPEESVVRVWLVDLTAVPATTRPLIDELTLLGHSPQWSADGTRIAFYSTSAATIVVYTPATGERTVVESSGGSSGALSPDGTQLVYPEIMVYEGSGPNTYLMLADLTTGEKRSLSEPGQGIDDSRALWRPDGAALAVARRDVNVLPTYQIYLLDPATGESQPLTNEARYSNLYFWWNDAGTDLVLQRFPELDEQMQPSFDGLPEIWTLDTATGALTFVAADAMLPRWVPAS